VRLFVLYADAAESEGESLFDVLDERAETAAYIHLLGDDAGNFSRAVCKILGEEMVFCRNILILDRLKILPRFRDQQLGLKYVRAAISRFGIGCRLAAIKPFPLQFEGKIRRFSSNECGLPLSSSKNSWPEALFLPAGLAMVVEQVMRGAVNCLVSIDQRSRPPDGHVSRCLKSKSRKQRDSRHSALAPGEQALLPCKLGLSAGPLPEITSAGTRSAMREPGNERGRARSSGE
jgi:hypothetical protein